MRTGSRRPFSASVLMRGRRNKVISRRKDLTNLTPILLHQNLVDVFLLWYLQCVSGSRTHLPADSMQRLDPPRILLGPKMGYSIVVAGGLPIKANFLCRVWRVIREPKLVVLDVVGGSGKKRCACLRAVLGSQCAAAMAQKCGKEP